MWANRELFQLDERGRLIVQAGVPLGSTDMGNVTQLLPGIHPVVAIDAGGAVIHQPGFTAAAAGKRPPTPSQRNAT